MGRRRKTRRNVPAKGRKPTADQKMPTAEPSLPVVENGNFDLVDNPTLDLCEEDFPAFYALGDRLKLFVLAYVEAGMNATAAARRLGYVGPAARTKGWALKRKPGVVEAVDEFVRTASLAPAEILALISQEALGSKEPKDRIAALKLLAQLQGMMVIKTENKHEVRDLGTVDAATFGDDIEEAANFSGM